MPGAVRLVGICSRRLVWQRSRLAAGEGTRYAQRRNSSDFVHIQGIKDLNVNQNPKAIANLILEVANALGTRASNLSVNKIAYFAHGSYLAKYKKPLIDAKIEAWQYGPVFREIYHEFKKCGDKHINFFAKELNLDTGEMEVARYELPVEEETFLRDVIESYLRMTPGYLVEKSHLADSPWHNAWYHEGRINPGMEISDAAILEYFTDQVRH